MSKLFTEYIASNNPSGTDLLLSRWNLKANNPQGRVEGLNSIIKHGREKGFKEVAAIHPDRKMILDLFDEPNSNVTGAFLEDINPPINNISKANPNQVVIDAKLLFTAAAGLLLLIVISKNI